ncbi:ribosomal RNA small subunit methyltransferase A [Candidatus Kaiserbacteria bacterium RIFCSPHIGHO2_01_FULL_46_22]|uniref:Ribosomal RNA small subunit methyltransferase A n=1 Tax=Candidatus Kaiserbacteria bacterium RIFCSPHIGHO2_01_FULL_46_22 TaxID=1798475 RepID=A0A1F6BWZ1_9BACT|nr:MAG: ribosomal RNA small subunit methyltransferase A [Candidatus Kaiserbacteria bacterium RIFCSPHIGHO2_01_FULL_46_22]
MVVKKFQTKKSLGQHFLNNPTVPRWLCDAAEIKIKDVVLEIGPGTGALTRELLSRGAKVVALEADPRAVTVLEEEFASELETGQFRLHHVDVRRFDPTTLDLKDHHFKVVANIPYYLTGQLFRIFLSGKTQPSSLVFLVQKEVGKRATDGCEKGGKESLLSLSIKVFGDPSYIKTVGKGHFSPPPKVDSAIVKVSNISRDKLKDLSLELFFELLHYGFGSKRKQLIGNLAKYYPRQTLLECFSKVEIDPAARAEDIPLETWVKLGQYLKNAERS